MKMQTNQFILILTLFSFVIFIQSCKQFEKEPNQEQIINKTVNSTDWPEEMDAMHAAPKNHKLLLENEKVRVLEVTVLPNETEALHHHQWPSVLHITETGDFIRRDGDGKVIADSRKFKKQPILPITIWKEPQKAHSVENLSDSITMKIIRVELKQ